MKYRYLLAPVLFISGLAAIGCTETAPPASDLHAQATNIREVNLAKLRSSPYYHNSAPRHRIDTNASPVASFVP
jgi:hypothetical protein